MDSNLDYILKEFEDLKGQHILSHGRVFRFIGIASDYWDYYYILWNGCKISWETCVSRITPLKGYILEDHYKWEYLHIARLNHWDQVMPDGVKHASEEFMRLIEKRKDHKLLAGPCWDLN